MGESLGKSLPPIPYRVESKHNLPAIFMYTYIIGFIPNVSYSVLHSEINDATLKSWEWAYNYALWIMGN